MCSLLLFFYSGSDLLLFIASHFFFKHGIKLILFVNGDAFCTAPSLTLFLKLLSQLYFFRDLAPEEVACLLLGVKVVPLRILIFILIKSGELRLSSSSVVLLLMPLIALILVAALIMIIAFVLVLMILSHLLLQRLIRSLLCTLNALRKHATLLLISTRVLLLSLCLIHHVIKGVSFFFIFQGSTFLESGLLPRRDEKLSIVKDAIRFKHFHVKFSCPLELSKHLVFVDADARLIASRIRISRGLIFSKERVQLSIS